MAPIRQFFQGRIAAEVAIKSVFKDNTALYPEILTLPADNCLYLLSFHEPVDSFMIDSKAFSAEGYGHPAIAIIRPYRMDSSNV